MIRVLAKGDVASQYRSRSEMIQAIVTEAVRCGWTFEDVRRAVRDPANVGGEKVQEMARLQANQYLQRSWRKATQLRAPSSNQVKDLDLGALNAVAAHLERERWSGTAGATDKVVMRILLGIADRAHRLEMSASAREIAERAAIHRNTASRSLQRLVQKGTLRLIEPAQGGNAARYRLVMPDGDTQVTAPPKDNAARKDGSISPPSR